MKKTMQIALGALGLAAASAWTSPAFAIDGLTANADFTTNYVFRGITQSANRPAVQGGLDYAIPDTGFAIGTWVSSIDFGDHTPFEWDLYANYNFNLGPVATSIGVIGYVYEWYGNFGPYTWVEPNIGVSHDFGVLAWSAKAFWAPSVPNGYLTIRNTYNPDSAYYLTTGVSVPVVPWLSVSGNLGYQGYSGGPTGHPDDGYTEWDIGATFTYDKYSLDLRYIDTSRHLLASTKAAELDPASGIGVPAFDTGPFYVATFKFAFP
ncbi:MAG TPA: TorF family putative porin [Micropepsaceae bacterium]|nr:TorF family putative porin [Micropepsaceae bacterium]